MFPKRKQKLGGFKGAEVDEQSNDLFKGPIRVWRTHDLLPRTSTMDLPEPCLDATPTSINSFLKKNVDKAVASHGESSSQVMISKILEIATNPHPDNVKLILGLQSEDPKSSNSPESKIVDLLSKAVSGVASPRSQALEHRRNTSTNSLCSTSGSIGDVVSGGGVDIDVETLVTEQLIKGNREGALEDAIKGKSWALALVIAGVCSQERYKEVVKLFADAELAHGTPAHTLALVFSGQADAAVQGGKTLYNSGSDQSSAKPVLLTQWRANLAAVLANRTTGWKDLVIQLGRRLLTEEFDVPSAHVAFLIANFIDPFAAASQSESPMLLGSQMIDQSTLGTCEGMLALKLTEILEFILSFPDFSCHTSNGLVASSKMSWYQPFKLQQAVFIADSGDLESACKYAQTIRRTIDNHKKETDNSKLVSYSPTFLHKLTLFEDRIAKCMDKDLKNSESVSSGVNGAGSGGGFLSKVGSAIFSGLDKMTQAEDDESNVAQQNPPPSQHQVVDRPAAINTAPNSGPSQMQAYHPHQNNASEASQNSSRAAFHSTSMPLTTAYPPEDSSQHSLLHTSEHSSQPLPNDSIPKPKPAFVSYSSDVKEPTQPPPPVKEISAEEEPVSPRTLKRSASTPNTSASPMNSITPNSNKNSDGAEESKKGTPTNNVDVAAPKGWIASKFSKWMYPDAAEATLGGDMDAYFDKDKGRWVFPGEDPAAADDSASSAPPPPPMKQAASSPNLASAGGGNDPLAALMLPPKRAMPSSGTNSSDPLAALMAPPQRAANFSSRASSTPAKGPTTGSAPPMFFNPAAKK